MMKKRRFKEEYVFKKERFVAPKSKRRKKHRSRAEAGSKMAPGMVNVLCCLCLGLQNTAFPPDITTTFKGFQKVCVSA